MGASLCATSQRSVTVVDKENFKAGPTALKRNLRVCQARGK